ADPPVAFTTIAVTGLLQLAVATYGGFFGGGIGIMMLAVLGLMGMEDIHAMNALKTLLATCINGVAVVAFILAGKVYWPQGLLMVCGAILGGYFGAFYAKKVNPQYVRWVVIAVGCVLTVYFFLRPH
ncbi:MAG TPA: sulfite exporter TauE/SafE family protein, partial [Aggregatilineales bacterium]|nr:sulfite exporter TauE/SafE family protein [Aggregatilineales bacterium]